MTKTCQDKRIKQAGKVLELEPVIKRSRAAAMLDRTPRTLARYEAAGLLHPIKLNSRSVVYRISEVRRLINGDQQNRRSHSQIKANDRT